MSESQTKKPADRVREHYTFILAIIVIVSFLIFFGVVLLLYKDVTLLEKMTALLSGFVAAVLGYFFGQRPAQEFAKQARTAESERDQMRQKINNTRAGFFALADERTAVVNEIEQLEEKLKRLEDES